MGRQTWPLAFGPTEQFDQHGCARVDSVHLHDNDHASECAHGDQHGSPHPDTLFTPPLDAAARNAQAFMGRNGDLRYEGSRTLRLPMEATSVKQGL